MDFEIWVSYVAAYTVLSLIPGPSVFMILGQSLSRGMGAAMYCILGDLLGGVVVMGASYVGLGVILSASGQLFVMLKWAGVAYMAYLGVMQIRSARAADAVSGTFPDLYSANSASLRVGFLTGVLNPKAILFYMVFLAQFIDPAQAPMPQFLILMMTSVGVVALVLGAYAVLASQLRQVLQSVEAKRCAGYIGGSFFLGGSALMATTR